MTRLLRLLLLAAFFGMPMLTVAPASMASPTAPFEEVAAARSQDQARPQQRQRRQSAQAPRRQRQAGQRLRRPRAAQG